MAPVISASRRTDIPGFYSEWFVNRLRAGFVYVQQPYSGRMSRVSLLPGDVSALVFWSKNYGPLLGRLEDVEKTTRNLFFHFTITGNHELEFHAPDPKEAIRDYIHIARRYSPDHIIWRYDPVCITDKLSFETHQERFVRCAELLQGHAKQCIISFAHPYRKAIENFKRYTDHAFVDLSGDVKRAYAARLAEKAARYGIRLVACCNDGLVSEQIGKARCIDGRRLSLLFGSPIDVRPAASRRECGCTRSVDIGAYDTCGHGCLYCYANSDKDRARTVQERHDPDWNSLRADVREEDGGAEPQELTVAGRKRGGRDGKPDDTTLSTLSHRLLTREGKNHTVPHQRLSSKPGNPMHTTYPIHRIAALLLLVLVSSCARPVLVTKPEDALERISWWRAAAPNDDLGFKDMSGAVRQSLEYYRKLPPDTVLLFGPERVTALDMTVTIQNFLLIIGNASLNEAEKARQIEKNFILYRSVGSDGRGRVLFTGYYEPHLSCRTAADDVFRYPLYRRPDDIIEVDLTQFGNGFPKNKLLGRLEGKKVIPYFSREEIDRKNALAKKDLEILWCDDLVDIYFLQVQGSGKVDLGDGMVLSILYDGGNGRPFKGVGSYLINSGIIPREAMSMQMIRQYLRDNPEQIRDILTQDPSYIFFKTGSGPSVGNIGVPLTPFRSIATDSKLFPKGALALISTEKPVIENNTIKGWVPFTRFVVNQDTGGAIRGPGRVDLFWGQGPEAELGAGYMQQEGQLYFLMRKKQE